MAARITELEVERIELAEEIDRITHHLHDPNRIDPESRERLNGRLYLEWKGRAEQAKRIKLARLRTVNLELKQLREEQESTRYHAIIERLDKIIAYMEEEVDD